MSFSRVFSDQVADRRAGAPVPLDTVSISDGEAQLTVRLAGGYITKAILDDEGEPVSVLYSDTDIRPAKINASHDMAPAGASDDIGGQHGVYRWADFEVAHRDARHLELAAVVSEEFLDMRKSFSLDDNGLTIVTELDNNAEDPWDMVETSLGQHMYWNMNPDAEGQPQVLPATGPAPLQDPEVYKAVMSGDSRYWSGFDGKATIVLPGIGRFMIESEAYVTDEDGQRIRQPVGLLLWHRPGTNSICFEPVVGNENLVDQPIRISSEVPNRQLYITAGAAVTLKTVISVVEAD